LDVVFAEASSCFEVAREEEEEEFVVGVGLAGGAPLVERRMGEGMSRHVACPSDHWVPWSSKQAAGAIGATKWT